MTPVQAPAGQPTPGPWRDVSASLGRRDYAATVATGADGMAIDCTRSGRTREEDFANARLIAASPDLLAALQEAVTAMSAATVHLPVNELPRIACNTAIANARAALSRATGSQP